MTSPTQSSAEYPRNGTTAARRFPGDRASAPDWFDPGGDLETLQKPSGGLLIFYDQKRNILFATDAGGGFAPSVTSSQTRF